MCSVLLCCVVLCCCVVLLCCCLLSFVSWVDFDRFGGILGRFGVVLGGLGEVLGGLGGLLGHLGGVLGPLGGLLGPLGGLLGASWAPLATVDGPKPTYLQIGPTLESILGPFGGPKREPKRSPRRSQIDQKIVLKNDRVLEWSWDRLGAILARSWAPLGVKKVDFPVVFVLFRGYPPFRKKVVSRPVLGRSWADLGPVLGSILSIFHWKT